MKANVSKGLVFYEAYVGRCWVRVARPRYWRYFKTMSLVTFGYDKEQS